MVLATEMTKHFEHVNKFVNSVNKPLAALEENEVRETAKRSCVWDPHPCMSLTHQINFHWSIYGTETWQEKKNRMSKK